MILTSHLVEIVLLMHQMFNVLIVGGAVRLWRHRLLLLHQNGGLYGGWRRVFELLAGVLAAPVVRLLVAAIDQIIFVFRGAAFFFGRAAYKRRHLLQMLRRKHVLLIVFSSCRRNLTVFALEERPAGRLSGQIFGGRFVVFLPVSASVLEPDLEFNLKVKNTNLSIF